jgi:hypothetical protein
MRRSLAITVLLSATLFAAMWGAVARAQVTDTQLDITEFKMQPMDGPTGPYSYPRTQAGGNKDVHLFFRFCGPGVPIASVANVGGTYEVTTTVPHGIFSFSFLRIRGVRSEPGANGLWSALPITDTLGNIDPLRFTLGSQIRPPSIDDQFAPGQHAQIASSNTPYGCVGDQSKSKLAEFKLQLPPGFLGNPTALEACPTFLWIAQSCPERSIVGHSVTDTVVDGASNITTPLRTDSKVYNVQTLGLEPARLGTKSFPSEPAGPFPIKIDLRTDGDYGLDSALIDIPKNLGGPQAIITQIETVLCAQVPCSPTDTQDPESVIPVPGETHRPFFRNPTSCKPAQLRVEARSWAANPVKDSMTDTFTPTGCENVPFEPEVSVTPTETDEAGAASAHRVTIQYPEYADDPIWQSQLKDVDLNLPEGMVLNPAGGQGLEACSFEDFGVDPDTNKQLDRLPDTCPEGSQIGTVQVSSPAVADPLSGKAFFGPVSAPGRPTADSPWKLFLLIEGAGLRIKLAGDVTVSETGQVSNFFRNQPETPFTKLDVNLNGNARAILRNPDDCGTFTGSAKLVGWNSVNPTPVADPPAYAVSESTPSITTATGCPASSPRPFNPVVEVAEGIPEKAGANSLSRIVFSRPDGDQNLTSLKLSLPAGATGSLAASPQCPLADAQEGNCPDSTRIGTIRNSVGVDGSVLTVPGELYLSEAIEPGDAASIAVRVPAKVGPIDLGEVVLMNRIYLREADNGLEVASTEIPTILEGVPLPIKRVEILVDRPGFFLNPTGCDPRTLTATFFGDEGGESSSSIQLDADKCDELPFGPDIRLRAGAAGQTDQFDHPPFQAVVTQEAGEADIANARVVLPAILRPNVPFFNEPGALCNDAQAATDTCPAKSKVGNARAFSPLLPYPISGPVHIVQEIGNVLPKVYVYLRGPTGLEVLLKARNSFLGGRRIINTFELVPDLPQSYFELNLNGGSGGILNNFEDLCQASETDREFDSTFTAHNGKKASTKPHLEIRGCEESDLKAASLTGGTVRVSTSGVAKVKIRCKRSKTCKGRLTLKGKGATGAGRFTIKGKKTKAVKVKFSRSEVRKIRKARRLGANAAVKIGDANTARGRVTLLGPKRKK